MAGEKGHGIASLYDNEHWDPSTTTIDQNLDLAQRKADPRAPFWSGEKQRTLNWQEWRKMGFDRA